MSGKATFSPTRWSLIAALRSGEESARRAALEALCEAYWYPLFAYARRSGYALEDAADLTQDFFAHLLEKEVFAQADRERGRLRTFLLTALQRFLCDDWRRQRRKKRGGGVPTLSIDGLMAERRYAREPADLLTPEALYHWRWALTVLDRAVNQLQDDYAKRGKAAVFEGLKHALTDDLDARSALEVGAQLGMEPGAVRAATSRLRMRYRDRLRVEVAGSMDARTGAEVDEEITALFRALG
jgi:RNA polymerase sigma-70 factor (ECF subfamily)